MIPVAGVFFYDSLYTRYFRTCEVYELLACFLFAPDIFFRGSVRPYRDGARERRIGIERDKPAFPESESRLRIVNELSINSDSAEAIEAFGYFYYRGLDAGTESCGMSEYYFH